MKNLVEFRVGDNVINNYTGVVYKVEKFNKDRGMCTLKDNSGITSSWNACNNAHFIHISYVEILILLSLWNAC